MKIAKADMKRVLDALQQLNEVRLERIRELIRQRNQYQDEVIQLKQELAKAQGNQDDRVARWRQRWVAQRDANKKLLWNVGELNALLAKKEQELRDAQRQVQYHDYAAQVKRTGMCPEHMQDDDAPDDDPHWCDKTPDHEKIVTDGGSPHRCGDCGKEWTVLD